MDWHGRYFVPPADTTDHRTKTQSIPYEAKTGRVKAWGLNREYHLLHHALPQVGNHIFTTGTSPGVLGIANILRANWYRDHDLKVLPGDNIVNASVPLLAPSPQRLFAASTTTGERTVHARPP